MNNILHHLWWDGLSPRRACKADDPTFEELKRMREMKREALYATLNEEQKRMLEEYEFHLDSENAAFSEEAFASGFRLGGQMIDVIK